MPTVAIVTPYFKESRGTLARCLASVKELKHAGKVLYIVVADGHPQDWLDKEEGVIHLRLPVNSNNWGNTPRCLGALLAVAQDAQYLAFLDADCTFDEDHIRVCLQVMADAVLLDAPPIDVVIARRRLRRPDWSVLCETDLDDPDKNADTNCFFLARSAFHTVAQWGLQPRQTTVICDQLYYLHIKNQGLNIRISPKVTVNYRTTWKVHYQAMGEPPPADAKHTIDVDSVFKNWYRDFSGNVPNSVELRARIVAR